MKKFLILCALCLVPMLGITTAAHAAQQSRIIGDADGNKTIDIKDVTVIQRVLAELENDNGGEITLRGDIDGDGLTIDDATMIQRYITGYRDNNRIGKEAETEPTQPVTKRAETPDVEF